MNRQYLSRHLAPLLLFLLVALYLTSPALAAFSSSYLGYESGDAYKMARHIWWFKTALQQGEDIFGQALLGYPEGYLLFRLWANPLQFFPMWLFAYFLPLPAAYNLGIVLTLALNGWSMMLLARRWLPPRYAFPALLAGLVFMIFPPIQSHLAAGHVGLLAQWPAPLFILLLFDYADAGGWRRFIGAAFCFLLAALGHSLQALYLLAPLTMLFLAARLYKRDYVGAARLIAVALAGCLALLIYLAPVLTEAFRQASSFSVAGPVSKSIDVASVFSPAAGNPFWRPLDATLPDTAAANAPQGAGYIGVLGGLLALIGILSRRAARWWLLVALAAWVLALGPVLKVGVEAVSAEIAGYEAVVPLPYALIMNLPLFELAWAPERFMLLFAAMFALLAGLGMATLWSSRLVQRRQRHAQTALAIVLSLFLIEDYRLFNEFPMASGEIPQAIYALSERRDIRAIYNAPYDNSLAAKEALLLQTAHGKPLIASHDDGEGGDRARLDLLASFRPSLLTNAHVDVVIFNKAHAASSAQLGLLQRARLWLGEPIFEDQRYAVFDTPFTPEQTTKLHSTHWDGQTHITYIYKQQPGWMEFSANLEAADRRVHLSLNGTPLETLQVNGRIPVSIPLPMARSGYHTFRIALDPPCPDRIDTELLNCQSVSVDSVDTRVLSNSAIYDPIRIAGGIVLAGYYLPRQFEDEVSIRLWWRFESNRSSNDVRFVHILDEEGLPVQDRPEDRSFGEIAAGSELTETITLDTSALQEGEYSVLTGWYELPLAIRFDVLTNVEGAENDTVRLGQIRVRK